MSRANPTPRWLKVVDSSTPRGGPTAVLTVVKKDALNNADHSDDNLVSLPTHELRTPLAGMLGFAELIDSGDLNEYQRQLCARVLLREGRRLVGVINSALAIQRLETGQRELDLAPVDLHSLIQRAVLTAGKDDLRPIVIDVPPQLPLVSADTEAILEVLGNFLSNARRFSPDGGAIRIAARPVDEMVEVLIADHGVGIHPDALPELFHKFYRAERGVRKLGPGAGLGLALNHKLVEAHGGHVDASSKGPGKGSRFTFTLPVSRPSARYGDVLVVEDDAGFASLMKAEFASQGLTTVRAADAETAEQILANLTPRAIVLDLALPGLQGEDFLARMRTAGGTRVPLVVLTGKTLEPGEITALEKAGALSVLPKEAGAPQAAVTLIAEALASQPVTL